MSAAKARHDTFFISHACKPSCTCKVDDVKPIPCFALVYALDVCTMHACMSEMHMPNLDYACKQIVSQGQWDKIYKHVYVLRCNPS